MIHEIILARTKDGSTKSMFSGADFKDIRRLLPETPEEKAKVIDRYKIVTVSSDPLKADLSKSVLELQDYWFESEGEDTLLIGKFKQLDTLYGNALTKEALSQVTLGYLGAPPKDAHDLKQITGIFLNDNTIPDPNKVRP